MTGGGFAPFLLDGITGSGKTEAYLEAAAQALRADPAAQILILYWIENVILGLLTLPRVLAARRPQSNASGGRLGNSIGAAAFFTVHYGVFCIGHLTFALALAGDFIAAEGGDGRVWDHTFGDPALPWAVMAMAAAPYVAPTEAAVHIEPGTDEAALK